MGSAEGIDHHGARRTTTGSAPPGDRQPRRAGGKHLFLNVPAESLSPELRQFITEYVHSVEQLEILCLLHESGSKELTVGEVFRVVQSSRESVAKCLESFHKHGFLRSETPGAYQFAARTGANGQSLAALVRAYHERRVAVIESIYLRPGDPIQDFADAFRLRKEK